MNDSTLATLMNVADLALHPNTPDPEANAAAMAFFRILRRHGANDHTALNLRPLPTPRGSSPIMPFGKYSGFPLSQIPTDYLSWLASCPWLRDPLKSQINSQLSRTHA